MSDRKTGGFEQNPTKLTKGKKGGLEKNREEKGENGHGVEETVDWLRVLLGRAQNNTVFLTARIPVGGKIKQK